MLLAIAGRLGWGVVYSGTVLVAVLNGSSLGRRAAISR